MPWVWLWCQNHGIILAVGREGSPQPQTACVGYEFGSDYFLTSYIWILSNIVRQQILYRNFYTFEGRCKHEEALINRKSML